MGVNHDPTCVHVDFPWLYVRAKVDLGYVPWPKCVLVVYLNQVNIFHDGSMESWLMDVIQNQVTE